MRQSAELHNPNIFTLSALSAGVKRYNPRLESATILAGCDSLDMGEVTGKSTMRRPDTKPKQKARAAERRRVTWYGTAHCRGTHQKGRSVKARRDSQRGAFYEKCKLCARMRRGFVEVSAAVGRGL